MTQKDKELLFRDLYTNWEDCVITQLEYII